MYVNQIS